MYSDIETGRMKVSMNLIQQEKGERALKIYMWKTGRLPFKRRRCEVVAQSMQY
jgi:hypothetical protein